MFGIEMSKMMFYVLFLPVIVSVILSTAVYSIYSMGKSKKFIKKEKKEIPFIKKILLIGYAENSKNYIIFAKAVCWIYWIYFIITIVCIALYHIDISAVLSDIDILFTALVFIRVYIMDIFIIGFFIIMTKAGKSGGVAWRWEK